MWRVIIYETACWDRNSSWRHVTGHLVDDSLWWMTSQLSSSRRYDWKLSWWRPWPSIVQKAISQYDEYWSWWTKLSNWHIEYTRWFGTGAVIVGRIWWWLLARMESILYLIALTYLTYLSCWRVHIVAVIFNLYIYKCQDNFGWCLVYMKAKPW